MEFQNDFDVQAPLEQVWDTMLDIERVAPCVPGASVLERTGDDAYKVAIKVKVGPVSMEYRGDVEIVEKDPASHTAVMSARAREARGQGTANANVRTALSANGDTTHGAIVTEVQLSGRAAAMGQGVIKDVSEKIIDQFAANLAAMLGGGGGGEAAAAGAAESAEGRGRLQRRPPKRLRLRRPQRTPKSRPRLRLRPPRRRTRASTCFRSCGAWPPTVCAIPAWWASACSRCSSCCSAAGADPAAFFPNRRSGTRVWTNLTSRAWHMARLGEGGTVLTSGKPS